MAIVNKYVVRNPFRVVGVYVDDPGKKMDDNVAELRPMVAKGVSFPFPTDLPGKLGPLTRTAAMVEEAVTDLADPERRELERLFWFYGSAGPVSAEAWINQAVRALMEGDIYDALKAYGQSFRQVLPQPSVRKQFYSRMYELLGAAGDSDPVFKLKYYFGAGETSLIESARPTPKPKPKPQPAPAPAPTPAPKPAPAPATTPPPEIKGKRGKWGWVTILVVGMVAIWFVMMFFTDSFFHSYLWMTIGALAFQGLYSSICRTYSKRDRECLAAVLPIVNIFGVIDLLSIFVAFSGSRHLLLNLLFGADKYVDVEIGLLSKIIGIAFCVVAVMLCVYINFEDPFWERKYDRRLLSSKILIISSITTLANLVIAFKLFSSLV